jgi:hypothetical protein
MKLKILFIVFSLICIGSQSPSLLAAESTSKGHEHWFTVTVLPKTPYAYYREKVEYKNGKIHFNTQMWKQEEGYLNEEQLGAYALDNEILTPLFYNFHSTYRANELTIDGTATENRLTIRIKRVSETQAEKPIITKSLPSKTIFSSFFPILLQKQFRKKAKEGHFLAILEDNEAVGFSPVDGSFKRVDPDEFAQSKGATRVEVKFSGNKSYWYLDRDGDTIRIEMPDQRTRVDQVTEESARQFLKKAGP